MTPRQIVALCLRVAAVIWLLYLVGQVNMLYTLGHSPERVPFNLEVAWLLVLLQLFACAATWFYPSTIAGKLLPMAARPNEPAVSPPRLEDWQTLGLILVGLWGLSGAIPDAAFWVTVLGLGEGSAVSHVEIARMASVSIRLIVSLWLVFGAQGFAAFLFKLRYGGVSKGSS